MSDYSNHSVCVCVCVCVCVIVCVCMSTEEMGLTVCLRRRRA